MIYKVPKSQKAVLVTGKNTDIVLQLLVAFVNANSVLSQHYICMLFLS